MSEDYTPSILIEPPSDSDVFDFNNASFGMFDDSNYPSPAERDMSFGMGNSCYQQAPALFIQPSDSSSISELSPLDEFPLLQTDYKYNSPASGRSSPIDAWSPASTFSGDLFPDTFSDEDFSWTQPQARSSSHSSPSLSPITSALDNVQLDEQYSPTGNHLDLLNGPPIIARLRSSSHSLQSVAPVEVWDGVGRGRSASFTASTTNSDFYRNDMQGCIPQFNYPATDGQLSIDPSFAASLGTGMSWGAESSPAASSSSSLGHLSPGWIYPSGEQHPHSSDGIQERQPPSPSLLTVPTVGLQRRPACSSRQRSRSHSDLASILPLEQDQGRGRGQHRAALSMSIPTSRSVSGSRTSSSRDASPLSSVYFSDVHTSSSYSPGSTSPSSSAFEDAETDLDVDGATVERRRTFAANRGAGDLLLPSLPATLNRASSAPSRGRRSKLMSSSPRNTAGLGVFKAVKMEASSPSFLSPEGSDSSSQQEFRVSPPAVAGSNQFKTEVASKKIRQASSARRINAALFECPLPTCSSTFTARHNLTNHINSHNKYRPHRCLCGMSFTTQGVLNRHKKRCRKD